MEKTIRVSDTGICATDGSQYSSIALLLAAGKTAFPGLESEGLYPQSIVLTSMASGDAAAGSLFTFAVNAQSAPTYGTVVQGGGQQFVVPGLDARTPQLLQNVWIVSMVAASDDISITAIF